MFSQGLILKERCIPYHSKADLGVTDNNILNVCIHFIAYCVIELKLYFRDRQIELFTVNCIFH